MYKLLIADDEPLIVKGLAKIIGNRLPEVQIVGEATNCPEAYQLILSEHPDIVITDIEMQGENGLRLPEEAARLAKPPLFVIISGYSRFDYAQRALRSGVEDYLLKPIDDDELIAVLGKMMLRIRNQQAMDVRLQSSEETSVESSLHVLLLGGDAAEGTLSAQMREQLLQRLHHAQFAVIRYFFADAVQKALDFSTLRPALESLLQTCFHTQGLVQIKGFHPGVLLAIVNAPQITEASLHAAALDSLQMLHEKFGRAPAAGFSDPIADMMQLQLCAQQANCALMMHLYEPRQRVFPYSQYLACLQQLPPEAAARQAQLADALCLPEADALQAQTASLYHDLYALRVAPSLILQCFADVLTRVQADRQQDVPDLQTLVPERVHALRNAMKYSGGDAYLACLKEAVAEVNDLLSQCSSGKSRRIIEKAKRYIREHCERELTLTEVAEALQMSPNYLSYLFKQETSVNFTAYITRGRVERAKLLLATRPDLRVYEIAGAVGYQNVKYFNRVFKQEVGLKPSEFREQYAKT